MSAASAVASSPVMNYLHQLYSRLIARVNSYGARDHYPLILLFLSSCHPDPDVPQ
jgi:hypothetical protein